jgi:SAM-dependent methyltransferase
MDPRDTRIIRRFYESQYETYGYDPRSLGWIVGSQQTRFRELAGIGDLEGCSILDVGCGFGDLYGYLLDQGIKVNYTGVDLSPHFLDIARMVYPDAEFFMADFEKEPIPGKFDWAFESGAFSLKLSDNKTLIRNSLKKMFKMVKKGIAADFLSSNAAIKDSSLYYQDPEELRKFCNTLSERITIKNNYKPTEFCIYIYK